MAKANSTAGRKGKRGPEDELPRHLQEQVYLSVRTALAICLLIEQDGGGNDEQSYAAGAAARELHKARLIMEEGHD